MKVFISWSGKKPKAVAAALQAWLPDTLTAAGFVVATPARALPWLVPIYLVAGVAGGTRDTPNQVGRRP